MKLLILLFGIVCVCEGVEDTVDQSVFLKAALDTHNQYRVEHESPLLTLDDEINKSAKEYAEYLAENSLFQHSDKFEYGENLYSSYKCSTRKPAIISQTQLGRNPVISWYNETYSSQYNYSTGEGTVDGKQYGHFTQLVWSESTKLGCGFAIKSQIQTIGPWNMSCNSYYVVCQYDPPGNIVGYFPENVKAPRTTTTTPSN